MDEGAAVPANGALVGLGVDMAADQNLRSTTSNPSEMK